MSDDDYSAESGHQAEPQPIIDAINRVLEGVGIDPTIEDQTRMNWNEPGDRQRIRAAFDDAGDLWSEAFWPAFGPEGTGSTAKENCGEKHPFVCADCGQHITFGRTCSMSVCSRCGVVWVRDSAIQKVAKVKRLRIEKEKDTKEWQKLHHLVLSPPPAWYWLLARSGLSRREAQNRTQKVVKQMLDEFRAQGLLVRHSYRFKHDDGSIMSEVDSTGRYAEVLFKNLDWWGEDGVRSELAWKPHYHAVVVSDWIEGGDLTTRVQEETGWVIHRITGEDGKTSLGNDGAMAKASTYTISHADILINPDKNNQSAVWEVGSFDGSIVKSSGRFTAKPWDVDWAEGKVREYAREVLGLQSGTTDCGRGLPAVDDPDGFARRIIEEIWPEPEERPPTISTDVIFYHLTEGNLHVDWSTTSGTGGELTVRDSMGDPISGGWSLPDDHGRVEHAVAMEAPSTKTILDEDPLAGCNDPDHDHGDDQDDTGGTTLADFADGGKCEGTLIPLGQARALGLLDDEDWRAQAPYADEALAADRKWPADMETWRASPGRAVGAIAGVG